MHYICADKINIFYTSVCISARLCFLVFVVVALCGYPRSLRPQQSKAAVFPGFYANPYLRFALVTGKTQFAQRGLFDRQGGTLVSKNGDAYRKDGVN